MYHQSGRLTEQEELEYVLALSMQDENIIVKPDKDPKAIGSTGMKSILKQEYKNKDGKSIQVRKGDLTQENTDCIVNAANARLEHIDGLAGAIVKTGGKSIQQECDDFIKKNGKLNEGDVYIGNSGTLKCQKIIHAVGPYYRNGKNFEAELLVLTLNNCLYGAANLGFSSISIPAISTGIFNFPKNLCAKLTFDTVLTYFEENKKTSLDQVRLVNFDDKTVEIFEKEFLSRFEEFNKDKTSDVMEMSEQDMLKLAIEQSKLENQISTSLETFSKLTKEIKVKNNHKIQLCIGDITLEDTDVIVNAANSRLDHSGGVALALANKAGSSMQKECFDHVSRNGPLDISQVYISQAGSLKCKALAHTIGPMYGGGSNNLVEYSQLVLAVLNCLYASEKLGFKSITFPAISTGKFGFPRESCGSLMFRTAKYFYESSPNTSIETIRFTVFDDDTLNVFGKIFGQVFEQDVQDEDFEQALSLTIDK